MHFYKLNNSFPSTVTAVTYSAPACHSLAYDDLPLLNYISFDIFIIHDFLYTVLCILRAATFNFNISPEYHIFKNFYKHYKELYNHNKELEEKKWA
jgi:hypothetical protein